MEDPKFLFEWARQFGYPGLAISCVVFIMYFILGKTKFQELTGKQAATVIISLSALIALTSITFLVLYYRSGSQAVRVVVHNKDGTVPIPNRGKVQLVYGDANPEETINDKGVATFGQVPPNFFETGARVKILFFDPEKEPWYAENRDSPYQLKRGEFMTLNVKLYHLDRITGVVRDFRTKMPIDSARVGILGLHVWSNQDGEFTLTIPDSVQKQYQEVTANKRSYYPWNCAIPVEAGQPVPIYLKRK